MINQFVVAYNYTVNRCLATGGPVTISVDGSMISHTLRDLNEDSNYIITIRAANAEGSTMATVAASTLSSGQLSK
jgi:hypothetical protein